jgi:1-pyrroline-5-carboxylate dehydrogenase
MGNVVIWKAASSSVYSGWFLMKLLKAAGLPDGVVNFLPGSGKSIGATVLASEHLGGIHFTGSTSVFQQMWKTVGVNIASYRSYPRIVGETGGKDFVFVHPSADVDALATALVRGSLIPDEVLCARARTSRSHCGPGQSFLARSPRSDGDVGDFTNHDAVIDETRSASSRLHRVREEVPEAEVIAGAGKRKVGYFIEPTVVLTTNPNFKLMQEEIFGPVLTIFVYEDADLDGALELCDTGSPYGLTGSVFANDRQAILKVAERLRGTAGNFYINRLPTARSSASNHGRGASRHQRQRPARCGT